MAIVHNLNIEQGIPFNQVFLVKNPDLSNKDLTGFKARMQFRVSYGSSVIAMNATTENSRLIIDELNSTCSIVLSEDDTSNLIFNSYVYDIEILSPSLVPTRLVQGAVNVDLEVTR